MSLEAVSGSYRRETESELYNHRLLGCTDAERRNYSINLRMLFDENYGLASTQTLKNKDIPEGGAKGTILPS
jgi:hypothetical protein